MIFGHQDTQQPTDNTNTFNPTPTANPGGPFMGTAPAFNQNPLAVDPATGVSLPTTPEDAVTDSSFPASMPAQPQNDYSFADNGGGQPDDQSQPVSDDLLQLKQQALAELSPLVDHLDQTPEEKFRTTMMMIQATDNQTLIPVAYQAAQAISDEKVRAQALLDLINEINYFTQHGQSGQ